MCFAQLQQNGAKKITFAPPICHPEVELRGMYIAVLHLSQLTVASGGLNGSIPWFKLITQDSV
jgi:hypothetical protein